MPYPDTLSPPASQAEQEILDLDLRVQQVVRVDALEALRLADTAVRLSSGGSSRYAGVARRARARALRLLGRYAESSACFAGAAREFGQAQDELEQARTLVGQVDVLRYLGDCDQALETAERARRVLHRCGDLEAISKLEMNVGNVFFHLDQFENALGSYRRARRTFARLQNDAQLAAVDANIGNVLAQLGNFDQALRYLRKARKRYMQLDHPLLVATVDLNLGHVWSCRGQHLRALDHLFGARRVFRVRDMQADVATTDLDISQSYLALGMRPEALSAAEEVIRIAVVQGLVREHGQALVTKAEAIEALDPEKAREALLQARRIFEEEGNTVRCALTDLRLSRLVSDPGEAVELARRAVNVLLQLHLGRWAVEGWLVAAQAVERLGDRREAEILYRRSIAAAESLGVQELRFLGLRWLARLTKSLPFYREAAGSFESIRPALGAEILKAGISAMASDMFREMACLLVEEAGDTADVFGILETARARELADQVALRSRSPVTKPAYDRASNAREMQDLRDQVVALHHRLRDAELASDPVQVGRIEQQTYVAERLLTERLREAEVFGAARGYTAEAAPVTLGQVQRALADDQLLIEYAVAGNQVLALAARKDRAEIHAELVGVREVADLTNKLHFQLNRCARCGEQWVAQQGKPFVRTAIGYLQRLYARLLAPIDLTNVREIVVVPDGPLHGIPFHALHDGSGYVLDRYACSISPSATIALGRPDLSYPSGSPLVMGASDRLAPHVATEAVDVANTLGVRPYVGRRATRSVFLRRAPDASVLHLAAHASIRHDNPQFSALHLADGPLAMHEVSSLHLQARLAVLSACATGIGAERRSGEIMSLARAFLASGVRELVVSLWPASDRVTAATMGYLYRELRSKRPGRALRSAQLAMKKDWPHPYYWASFAHVGC
ncbi:MAG TPA: CHAT domain-containing tetratricopeptide repeat protein [Chloroflexota bacterium]|nr:CHAT domain-containing tetratricopeptide repeat protein [Chloroflexota bacterium]